MALPPSFLSPIVLHAQLIRLRGKKKCVKPSGSYHVGYKSSWGKNRSHDTLNFFLFLFFMINLQQNILKKNPSIQAKSQQQPRTRKRSSNRKAARQNRKNIYKKKSYCGCKQCLHHLALEKCFTSVLTLPTMTVKQDSSPKYKEKL